MLQIRTAVKCAFDCEGPGGTLDSLLRMIIPPRTGTAWAALCFALLSLCILPAEETAGDFHRRIVSAFSAGKADEALQLANRAIEANPDDARLHLARGFIFQHRRRHAEAVEDLSRVIELDPGSLDAWQRRGEEHFKLGRFRESVADFEKVLELAPRRRPRHWQLGIAYYYTGEYRKGMEIFESHRTVENMVWHYLCTARAHDLKTADERILPVGRDPRVPMSRIHALFAGNGSEEAVLESANRGREAKDAWTRQMFYAHLYLGLHHEIRGNEDRSLDYLRKAAQAYRKNGYMGEVARVHLAWREAPKADP